MTQRELRVQCSERGCQTLSSGIWRVIHFDKPPEGRFLCAKCGFIDYMRRREFFAPVKRVELVKTLGTKFVQSQFPKANGIAEKSWVEHPVTQDRVYANGMTASEILNFQAKKRLTSTVAFDFHRDPNITQF